MILFLLLLGQMSSFEFFFGWLFASQKMREMLCISRPEFAMQTRAFQGYVRTSCYLHSFAPLRNWLRQPLQSLPRFVNQILEIEPINYSSKKEQLQRPPFLTLYNALSAFSIISGLNPFLENETPTLKETGGSPSSIVCKVLLISSILR